MGVIGVCLFILVSISTSDAGPLLSRLLRLLDEDISDDVLSISKKEIYLASANSGTITFFIQTTYDKCRLSCSEGATSWQRHNCRYRVTLTNDNNPSETYIKTVNYWDPADQKATFPSLQDGQMYSLQSCRLDSNDVPEGPCDTVWCITTGINLSNDNCSSKKDMLKQQVNPIRSAKNLDHQSRYQSAMDDLNDALQRLAEL